MILAYQFIVSLYLKRFATFLLGAEAFFLLIDFLQNQKHLPSSANQILLYIFYQGIAGLGFTLPLTLCFAVISVFATLSKTNEAMALLSLGFSRKRMVLPIAISALLICLLHIGIISSDAGRSYDNAQAILKGENRLFDDGGLMFTFQNSIVTAEGIDWIKAEARGVRIFELNDTLPVKMIYAKTATYNNNFWELKNAISIDIPTANKLDSNALPNKKELGNITTLEGFWPKILDNISNSQGVLSFTDLAKALWLLLDSDLNTDKLRAKFFSILTSPIIVTASVLMLSLLLPINSRSTNWIAQSAVPSFAVLVIWGTLMALEKIMSSTIFGLWPVVVMLVFIFSARLTWRKN